MPEVGRVGNVVIRLYFRDTDRHKRPHFHVASPDGEILVDIVTTEVLAGEMDDRDIKRVIQ